jgi:hypothetical protein
MTKYSKLEKFLRHRDFILCVAIASVIWLTPNTYFVYFSFMEKHFASPWMEIAASGVSLIVASGILIYTLRGNMRVANYYMWFEISISSFYYITTIGWDWALIPAFSFVFMLPISLKHYTVELNKNVSDDKDFNTNNNYLEGKVIELQTDLVISNAKNEEYRQALNESKARLDENTNTILEFAAEREKLKAQINGNKMAILSLEDKINELTPSSGRIPGLNNVSEADLMNMAKSAEKDTFTPSPDIY